MPDANCEITPPASLASVRPLSPRGAWSHASLNLSHVRWDIGPGTQVTPERANAAIWRSQFRAGCDRLLLFEDDMAGAGLGFTSGIMQDLLLWAVTSNRVLVEVPANGSWNGARSHMPYNEGRKPSVAPRWCDNGPRTHACYYQRLSHCEAPPPAEHVAPHLGNVAWSESPSWRRNSWPPPAGLQAWGCPTHSCEAEFTQPQAT